MCFDCFKPILQFLALALLVVFAIYIPWFFYENVSIEKFTVDIKDIIQLMITTIFGSVTAFFSYYAYRFAKEKFRLDLLQRRWEIYEEVLKFCSGVITHGGIPQYSDDSNHEARNQSVVETLKAAQNSFRGIGYHKTKSLFGSEVEDYFDKINKAFSWLSSFSGVRESEHPGVSKERTRQILFINDTIKELPNIFKPYIYFGDFKK